MALPKACRKLGVLEIGLRLEEEDLCCSGTPDGCAERPPLLLRLSLREGAADETAVAIWRGPLLLSSLISSRENEEYEGGSSEKGVGKIASSGGSS